MRYENFESVIRSNYPNWSLWNTGGGIMVGYGDVKTKDNRKVLVSIGDENVCVWVGNLKKENDLLNWKLITYNDFLNEKDEEISGDAFELSVLVMEFDYDSKECKIVNDLVYDLFDNEGINEIKTLFNKFTEGYGVSQ